MPIWKLIRQIGIGISGFPNPDLVVEVRRNCVTCRSRFGTTVSCYHCMPQLGWKCVGPSRIEGLNSSQTAVHCTSCTAVLLFAVNLAQLYDATPALGYVCDWSPCIHLMVYARFPADEKNFQNLRSNFGKDKEQQNREHTENRTDSTKEKAVRAFSTYQVGEGEREEKRVGGKVVVVGKMNRQRP